MYVSQMSVVIDLKVILKKKTNYFNNKKGENSRTEKCHIKKKKKYCLGFTVIERIGKKKVISEL